jgi:hypothetical protein
MSEALDELTIAEEPAGGRPDECVVSAQLGVEYRRLIAEQGALRRLAALVARGVEPMEVFGAVAEEMPQRGRSALSCVRSGVRGSVGVPILDDGHVRGLGAVGSMQRGPMSADTEVRISRFAELSASAVVAGKNDSCLLTRHDGCIWAPIVSADASGR